MYDSYKEMSKALGVDKPQEAEKAKAPTFVPDWEAFNSYIGDGFLVPELEDESEASEDDQTDNVSNEALYVNGSGDRVSRYLQDVAKGALSCQKALGMQSQELLQ